MSSFYSSFKPHNSSILVQPCDLALHFTSRLIQKLVLTAHKWDYETILADLRIIAEVWSENKPEALCAIDRINQFKQMVLRKAPVWEIWNLILSIEKKAFLTIQQEFMVMLKRNLMLEYSLSLPQSEVESECLQGEHSIGSEKLPRQVKSTNEPKKNDFWSNKNNWVLMMVSTHKQLLVTPIRWEGSMSLVSI